MSWDFTPPDWKNEALSQQLYEAAFRPSVLEEMFGPTPPPTRRQRCRWKVEEMGRRLRRAMDALTGRDED